jgi:hypothetical protein
LHYNKNRKEILKNLKGVKKWHTKKKLLNLISFLDG